LNARDRTVLVVDDESATRKFVGTNLKARGFTVYTARDGAEALRIFNTRPIELVILDLDIPPPDGFDVCAQIRAESDVPIVILSASGRESTKVRALELGADDYVTKPFGVPELMARVGAALRRTDEVDDMTQMVYESGKLVIDLMARQVIRDGRGLDLTPTEYRLIKLLVQHEGKVLSHRKILRSVWGPSSVGDRDYLRTYVHRLRSKIERDPGHAVHILSIPGTGYCFVS